MLVLFGNQILTTTKPIVTRQMQRQNRLTVATALTNAALISRCEAGGIPG